MVPSAVKNFFLLCSAQELGHKPGLIVSISSSRNGAYPVAELRMSSFKNNRLLYIPEHLILRDVEKMFNPGEPGLEDDIYYRQRLDYCLQGSLMKKCYSTKNLYQPAQVQRPLPQEPSVPSGPMPMQLWRF